MQLLAGSLLIEQRLEVNSVRTYHAQSVLCEAFAFPEHRTATLAFIRICQASHAVAAAHVDLGEAI
jgi:hypothetical protein